MTEKMVPLEAAQNAVSQFYADGKLAYCDVKKVLDALNSLAIPVEEGAIDNVLKCIEHDAHILSAQEKKLVQKARAELAALRKPMDREEVRKFVNDELYTHDVPVEGDEASYDEVVDAIMALIGRKG
jgi:hypothetical protein